MTGALDAPDWVMAQLSDDQAFELWQQARERSVLVSIEQGSVSGRWIAHVDGPDIHARAEAVTGPYDAAREALAQVAAG